MTSSYTTNKSIEKPASGDYPNTWATPVNTDWDLIDTCFGGVTTLTATGVTGSVVLTSAQYQPPNIKIVGTLTGNVNYVIPSGKGGMWTVYNNTSGSYTVIISSGGGGSYLTISQGSRALIVSDGTNIQSAVTIPAGVTAAGSNTQIQYNNDSAFGASDKLTFDGTDLSVTGNFRATGSLVLVGSSSGTVSLSAAATSANTVYTMPAADGTANQVLQTNGSGVLGWYTVPPDTGTTTNALTFNNSNTGAASGATFDGSSAVTISANSLGAVASSAFTGTNQSLATSGWQNLPGGLIIQWGKHTYSGSNTATITFPKAFTTAVLSITCSLTDRSTVTGNGSGYSSSVGLTSFVICAETNAYWMAIGY